MKQKITLPLVIFLTSVLLLAACGGTAEPVTGEIALEVGGTSFTMTTLEAMDTIVVESTKKDGTIVEYTGVPVMDVLEDAGLEGETVVFIASDGYEAELAMSELEGCADCVVAFDDGELRMVLPGFPGSVQVKGVIEINVK